ncbi:hypothetical protein V8G54_023043 [Vigna mungo]|uniref:Sm domain-containing protein n=1 Tax=Vigna mungo TaxID=3915 RepID=A0AAQ3RPY5_VIGMU
MAGCTLVVAYTTLQSHCQWVSPYHTHKSGRKETVLDLAKFVDKGVQVKLTGGRQVTGTLKGYDQLLNLVLDEAVDCGHYVVAVPVTAKNLTLQLNSQSQTPQFKGVVQPTFPGLAKSLGGRSFNPDDPLKTTDQTRQLGLIVCRGTAVMLVSPTDGTDEIANPFIQPDGA